MSSAPALWTKHRPIAHALAREFRLPGADADDVTQEALIALWEACRAYDKAKGPFPPFARLVVTRHLTDLLRVASKRCTGTPGMVPLFDTLPAPESQRSLDRLLESFRKLCPAEKRAVSRHLNGVPFTVSKTHERDLSSARRKMRVLLETRAA